MKTIEVIRPVNKFVDEATNRIIKKKRVCAYARVSTDDEDQVNSYRVQVEEYTNRIQSNPEWEFAGIYADLGLSGTSMKKRPEFMKMVERAKKGEIDLILVKAISRFARNTVDILQLVRELRQIGCIIFFEKENIYSDNPSIDFTLSILSSIAQEESRSISSNVKWSVEKKFKNGIVHNTRIYGYELNGKPGELIVNEGEAKIVQLIFSLFLQGYSVNDIVKILNDRKIPSALNKKWVYSTVRKMLSNEKYTGDALCQKTITTDYLSHKQVENDNLAPKYFIRNNHDPIVSRAVFEAAQTILSDSALSKKNMVTKYPLTNLVYCAACHRNMRRHHIHAYKGKGDVVLNCKHNPLEKKECVSSSIDNDLVMNTIKAAVNALVAKEALFNKLIEVIKSSTSSAALDEELFNLRKSLSSFQMQKEHSEGNALANLQNQEKEIKRQMAKVQKEIASKLRNSSLADTLATLKGNDELFEEPLFIKTLCQLIIFDNDVLMMVISKTKTTEELVSLIDEFKKVEPIIFGQYINYDQMKGLNYKVIYHE